jgi:hypothetical protein
MEDKERAHCNAHFQEKLKSLKVSVARLTSLKICHFEMPLVKVLPTNPSPIFRCQQQLSPKKEWANMVRSLNYNLTFVQSTAPTLATAIVEAFANESHKIKSSDDINQDKMVALKVKIKAIERVNLYDLVHVVLMCLIPNVVVPKKFCVLESIKYIGTQCPMTHLKSYYNKMEKSSE